MALLNHTGAVRIYGKVFGTPPFQNAAGTSVFSDVDTYPSAPAAYVPTTGMTIWPLSNGVLVGNTYVYSVLELTPAGLNQQSVKLATDQSASSVASGSS